MLFFGFGLACVGGITALVFSAISHFLFYRCKHSQNKEEVEQ